MKHPPIKPMIMVIAVAASALVVPGRASALPKDASFTAQGLDYVAEAVGRGASEADAQNDALRTAVSVIMESLGKDRLFTELFLKNPPVTMSWKKLSSEKGPTTWTVRLRLVVDDESLRLLYNSAYVSTVSTIIDGAEARLSDAERLGQEARASETDGLLGRAMSLYWQARDACDAGLELLSPVGDAAVLSTFGKKKAPELRELLSAARASVVSGYDRIKAAERSLAADEELSAALAALEELDAAVADTESWARSIGSRASRIEGMPKAELKALSDELAARLRGLSDSRLALARLEESVPKGKEMIRARIDVIRRRIDAQASYLGSTKSSVDREYRDPAIARAKRAQNVRWALLHEPTGALAFRFYTPFGLDPAATDIRFADSGIVEYGLRSERAFGKERGAWAATAVMKDDDVLFEPSADGALVKSVGYAQSADIGLYGRGLFGLGFRWDWLRRVAGEPAEKRTAARILVGGVDRERHWASWLLALSWELPYDLGGFEPANELNVGLEALGRLGSAVELKGGLSLRPREAGAGMDTSLEYSIGAGVRLPKPFLWGIELAGYRVRPLGSEVEQRQAAIVRFFLEYSL